MNGQVTAFSGAGCVGKTTLINLLKMHFVKNPEIGFIREACRDYFEANPMSEEQRFSSGVQSAIQHLAIQDLLGSFFYKHAYSDRSIFDAPAYLYALGHQDWAKVLLQRAAPMLSWYEKIYLLSPEGIEHTNDSIRSESADTRTKLHNGIVEFFDLYEIPYRLLVGTPEQRLAAVWGEGLSE